MNPAAYQAYRSTSTATASPGQLVLTLYDGALRFVGEAARAFEANDRVAGGAAIVRVERIVIELLMALDFTQGGQIASSLGALYQYMITRLSAARNAAGGPALHEVAHLLRTLREGWDEADRAMRAQGAVHQVSA